MKPREDLPIPKSLEPLAKIGDDQEEIEEEEKTTTEKELMTGVRKLFFLD